MNCEETKSEACLLRHKKQEETEEKINKLYEVICGGLHPENSLSTKVDEMYRENQAVKNFIKGCIVSLIALVFWSGYQFAVLQSCVNKLGQLEAKIESLGK